MNVDQFSVSWFDLIVVGVLIMGIFRGRKNGMSVEFTLVLQWITTVLGAALCYKPLGTFLIRMSGITRLWADVFSYVTCMILISIIFALIRRYLGGKVVGTDTFGSGEYYLGMVAGGVRFACFIMVFMALLHARLYTPKQLEANQEYQEKWFGDIRFPTLGTTWQTVFKKSFIGRNTANFASVLLIEPSPLVHRKFKQKEFDVH